MKKLLASFLVLVVIATAAQSASVNVTYRYLHNGNVWYTETKTATVGEAYPEIVPQPAGVKYLTAPVGTVTAATTVDIECVYTNKAVSSFLYEDINSAPWCFLTIKDAHLQYVSGQNYTTIKTSQTTRPAATDYSYQWKIYGNPIQGFKIVNREAGTSSLLTSPAPTGTGGTTYPVVMAESGINTTTHNLYWDIKEGAGLSFYLARKGETSYLNHYGSGGKLAFWTEKADAGSLFGVVPVDKALTAATTLSTTKYYMLVNRHTGAALGEGPLKNYNASVTAGSAVYEENVAVALEANTDNHGAIWQLEQSGTGYKLKNYNTSNYLSATTTVRMTATGGNGTAWYNVQKCDNEGTAWYLCPTADGYYNLTSSTSTATGASEKVALCDDGYFAQFWTTFSKCSEWELREVTPTSASTPTYTTSITSGRYYRLVNNLYPTLALTENQGKVSGTPIDKNSYGQIWKVTRTNNNYTLQNALTGKYIQTAPGTSVQFSTGTTSKNFLSGSGTASGNTYFTFYTTGTSYYTALHCASSQNYNVVGWQATADASRWLLEEVTLSSADLAAIEATQAIANGTGTNYTTQLSNFFSDYACTTLKSTYAGMTDAQLRSAMSSLPSALQDMAVRVKNNTWNTEEGTLWNHYEKDFRIHNYEIYSNCDQWQSVTGIGVFAHLTNPTGIQGKPGDVIYVFVGSNVKDSNATLQAELVEGTKTTGSTVTLSRGYNAIYVSTECELFISYLLNNTSSSCNNYPDITIHIEGGTCNGFFDMYRGHNNNDWIWMKENMFKNKYLHVKGNSVLLNVEREDVYAEQNATGVMRIWDFIFDTEESFAGCDQWKNTGQYKMMLNSFQNEDRGTNPFWNGANHGTSHPDLTAGGTFNYNGLANGGLWEVAHEIGHGHQIPIIRSAGTDETSNNVMSQIIQFLPKDNIDNRLFQSAKATRGDGVKRLTEHFTDGMSYIDMIRRRMIVSGVEGNDNITNRWLFQLWMYYDYLGHYQPTGGNNGFAFVSALYDKLRATPLGTSVITTPAQDYLRMAQFCAEIVQTDLSEFFEVWGFWRTTPKYTGLTIPTEYASESTTKTDTGTTYYVGGYTNRAFDMSNATSQVNTVRNAMKAYSKKGTNIIFMEDRGVGCTLSQTMDGLDPQTLGDHGYYEDFTKTITGEYKYAINGTNVVMTGGENAVGFKIYDASGNLVALSNMDTFSVPEAVATGLANGTYTLVAAQGDGTDVATTQGEIEEQPTTSQLFTLNCARGYLSSNGTKLIGTTTAANASQFAIVTYEGQTYLYDATQKAFVCHTTDAKAGTSGNVALESQSDFSKIVKGLTWGNTNITAYPYYLEDSWGNWLNMDGGRNCYMNTWKNFESGNGGNTYAMTIVEAEYDVSEAIAMLEAYFNPTATVTYVISDASGVVYTSDPISAATGTTITSLPTSLRRDFCSYSAINHKVKSGANTVQVTVSYNLPFSISTSYSEAVWYYMHGHASYNNRYISTNGDATVWGQGNEKSDAYQWAFMGNPYEGIKLINKASGNDKYLQGTNPATMGTDGKAWILQQQTNTTYQSGESGFGLWDETLTYLNTQGSTLKYWGQFDQGSTFWVEEVSTNFAEDVVAAVGAFFAEDAILDTYFTISSETKAQWQARYNQYSVTATEAQYHEIVDGIDAAIIYPETGRYRIKSSGARIGTSYIGYGWPQEGYAGYGEGLITIAEANIFSEPTTIITLTRQGNTNTYTLGLINGLNVQNQTESNKSFPATTDEGAVFAFVLQSPGVVAITSDFGTYSYLHESGVPTRPAVVKWTADAGASHWMVEDVAKDGDVNNDGFVNNYDLPLLINLLLNKPGSQRTDGSDANRDGVITLADVTKLVNILNEN